MDVETGRGSDSNIDEHDARSGRYGVETDRALDRIASFPDWMSPLGDDPDALAAVVRVRLGDPARRQATLILLSLLETEVTLGVADLVVALSASDRHALLARRVLGRLPFHESQAAVGPVVDHLLDSADDHEYRRYAALLSHLGLHDALESLCARARDSSNGDVHEVAEEFGRDPVAKTIAVDSPEALSRRPPT